MIFTAEAGFAAGYDDDGRNRLNARFSTFMLPFKAEFEGKRVLDLGSHDGRWSYAALILGASHVTGIEGRPELIQRGAHLFERAELRERADFIAGDIFDVMSDLRGRGETFDIVLCLGIFYHVMDHYRLLKLMHEFGPSLIIVDTGLINDERPFINLHAEPHDNIFNAIPVGPEPDVVVGYVSKGGLQLMANSLGWDVHFLPWVPENYANKTKLEDYFTGNVGERRRFSAILRRR